MNVCGAGNYAVRIGLDPGARAARGLGSDQVPVAVRNGNVDLPTGTLYGSNRTYSVMVNGQFDAAKPFADLVVSYQNGGWGWDVQAGCHAQMVNTVLSPSGGAWIHGSGHVHGSDIVGTTATVYGLAIDQPTRLPSLPAGPSAGECPARGGPPPALVMLELVTVGRLLYSVRASFRWTPPVDVDPATPAVEPPP